MILTVISIKGLKFIMCLLNARDHIEELRMILFTPHKTPRRRCQHFCFLQRKLKHRNTE